MLGPITQKQTKFAVKIVITTSSLTIEQKRLHNSLFNIDFQTCFTMFFLHFLLLFGHSSGHISGEIWT